MTEKDPHQLFTGECTFLRAASMPEHFAPGTLPEIAFVGRSNVGKSSLINALTGRKHLARSSKTPGRTQEILFFELGKRLMLVDLPGYGHAKAPHAVKDSWNDLVQNYLGKRPQLKWVGLLIDARHGALANDREMMSFLDRFAVSYQTVFTKTDLLKPHELEERHAPLRALLAKHPAARPDVLAVSAEKRTGIEELRQLLAGFAAPDRAK